MRKKLLLFCLFGTILIGFATNSCKKESQDYLETLLTDKQWQLASVMVFNYVGNTQNPTDTLNTTCGLNQIFKFNTDNTCTYTNFDCVQQTTSGHWSFSSNELYLMSDLKLKDTTAAGSSIPFQNAQILNLGQYSLILQTGYLNTYYSPTQVRTITQYGFIRVNTQ
jgi:hypothetical protein